MRLVQSGESIRVFINGEEMDAITSCSQMGEYLVINAGVVGSGHVYGYFEYVKLWEEAILPENK